MTEIPTSLPERRRHARTQLRMNLRVIRLDPDGGDVIDLLRMVDISKGGIGAISDRQFYPGQRIVLCLPLSSHSGRRNIHAKVVRCRQKESGFCIGLEFDSISVGAWGGYSGAELAAA